VGVRVDEAGEEHATVEIDHLGVDAFEEPHLVAPTEADDPRRPARRRPLGVSSGVASVCISPFTNSRSAASVMAESGLAAC